MMQESLSFIFSIGACANTLTIENNTYHELFGIEQSWLIQNNLTDCIEYEEANLYAEDYPMYAFELLVDCYSKNMSRRLIQRF